MKLTSILLACLMCTTLMAKTTVVIPLQVEMNRKIVTTAEINKKFNAGMTMDLLAPSGCYIGAADVAVDILAGLSDGPFSDQLGFFGYKYKKETHLIDSSNEAESIAFLNKESKIWKNWKGADESILILFHISDEGDDVAEALITKCK